MNNLEFEAINNLWLLILIPVITTWYYVYKDKRKTHISYNIESKELAKQKKDIKILSRHILILLRLISICCLIIALTKPVSISEWKDFKNEGIDIILAIDISTSMLAEDLNPTRLEASKKVAEEFIKSRPNDRIGLVVFGGESFTQCPITTDHKILLNLIKEVKCGMVEDGTAIGMGMSNGISRLKDSKSKSKIIILITDGKENKGEITNITAAEIAKEFGIKIYTIAVGTKGISKAQIPVTVNGKQYFETVQIKGEFDEEILQDIATITNGKFYRATNNTTLKKMFLEIDKLEKSLIEVKEYHKKKKMYLPFVLISLILLIIEFILKNSIYKSLN
ncbi:MAG: aerotolerance regulator BatA [Flavobacteriales bacterium]|nr:aerotolerance regulator BatA [Flavobacteriales bacterium]|tara:strand:- start:371 stop:1378 length:1008 start_codon:yes stop_codon:yes gene_type:complete